MDYEKKELSEDAKFSFWNNHALTREEWLTKYVVYRGILERLEELWNSWLLKRHDCLVGTRGLTVVVDNRRDLVYEVFFKNGYRSAIDTGLNNFALHGQVWVSLLDEALYVFEDEVEKRLKATEKMLFNIDLEKCCLAMGMNYDETVNKIKDYVLEWRLGELMILCLKMMSENMKMRKKLSKIRDRLFPEDEEGIFSERVEELRRKYVNGERVTGSDLKDLSLKSKQYILSKSHLDAKKENKNDGYEDYAEDLLDGLVYDGVGNFLIFENEYSGFYCPFSDLQIKRESLLVLRRLEEYNHGTVMKIYGKSSMRGVRDYWKNLFEDENATRLRHEADWLAKQIGFDVVDKTTYVPKLCDATNRGVELKDIPNSQPLEVVSDGEEQGDIKKTGITSELITMVNDFIMWQEYGSEDDDSLCFDPSDDESREGSSNESVEDDKKTRCNDWIDSEEERYEREDRLNFEKEDEYRRWLKTKEVFNKKLKEEASNLRVPIIEDKMKEERYVEVVNWALSERNLLFRRSFNMDDLKVALRYACRGKLLRIGKTEDLGFVLDMGMEKATFFGYRSTIVCHGGVIGDDHVDGIG